MNNILTVGKDCVGCRSCEQVCPHKCISMQENKEGFLYPVVDDLRCTSCGLCRRKCPALGNIDRNRAPIEIYALKEKDKEDVFYSASGGASNVAAKVLLDEGGYVYGAAYDENLKVSHIEVSDEQGRKKIQSSKYVQSDISNSFSLAKRRLEEGDPVLFTGTPCQIAGLHMFLGKPYTNLFTMDLICHGVPSPLLFKKYLAYQKKKLGEEILSYNFRSKEKRGWGTQYLAKIEVKTKAMTRTLSIDKYGKHFMSGDCYRECCYQCKYANTNRCGDLTIGDFWGIEKCHPKFSSKLGVSVVLVNTDKGKELLKKMKKKSSLLKSSLDEAMIKQGNLVHPAGRPEARNTFYDKIEEENYVESLRIGLQLKERIKIILPAKMVKILKRYLK